MTRCVLLGVLSLVLVSRAEAQDCRDATGEPVACVAVVESAPIVSAPIVSAPIESAPSVSAVIESAPSAPASNDGTLADPEAYFNLELVVDLLGLSPLSFTQAGPDRAPEAARDARLFGGGEVPVAGLSLAFGARPFPWLRLPEFRLTVAGGDFEGDASGAWQSQGGTGSARLERIVVMRAELAGGFELPFEDVAFFALGHVALAGYLVEARLDHPVAGDLGVATLAEDAWELGFTVGAAFRVDRNLRIGLAYRHVATGAESNGLRISVELTHL